MFNKSTINLIFFILLKCKYVDDINDDMKEFKNCNDEIILICFNYRHTSSNYFLT